MDNFIDSLTKACQNRLDTNKEKWTEITEKIFDSLENYLNLSKKLVRDEKVLLDDHTHLPRRGFHYKMEESTMFRITVYGMLFIYHYDNQTYIEVLSFFTKEKKTLMTLRKKRSLKLEYNVDSWMCYELEIPDTDKDWEYIQERFKGIVSDIHLI